MNKDKSNNVKKKQQGDIKTHLQLHQLLLLLLHITVIPSTTTSLCFHSIKYCILFLCFFFLYLNLIHHST